MNQSGQHITFFGWAVFLLLLYLASKTDKGYHLIYYGLMLILVFLLVNHYKQIDAAMIVQSSTQGG